MKQILKRIPIFEISLILVILGIHSYAAQADAYAFPNHWFKRDDAYYYFKVAQNVTEGKGSTFDGINPTNGYHPLWMLVCIPIFALARFDLILPLRVLLVVIAAMHAATAVMLYRLAKDHLSQGVAILAAAFWSFDFYIHETIYKMGLETPIAALTIVATLSSLSHFEKTWRTGAVPLKRIAGLALLAALAMFSRLDLVFFAVLTGLWIILRGKPLRFLLPLDLVIVFVSMTGSVLWRTGFKDYNTIYASSALEAALVALIVKPILLYIFGAYRHARGSPLLQSVYRVFSALAVSAAGIFGIYVLLVALGFGLTFPRSAFLLDFGVSLILILALRLAAAWFGRPGNAAAETPAAEFKANWKGWLKEGSVYYGIVGGLLAAYMLFNQIMFGTSSPVSGQIKRWWGSMPSTIYENPAADWFSFFGAGIFTFDTWKPFSELFWQVSERFLPRIPGFGEDDRYYLVMFLFLLGGAFLTLLRRRGSLRAITNMGLVPLAAGCLFQILSYTASSYGGAKEWYWAGQMLLLTLTAAFLADTVLRPLQKIRFASAVLSAAAVLFAANMAWTFHGVVRYAMPQGRFPQDTPLMDVVEFLEENSPPGSIIGLTGGGNVGYFIEGRTVVNMDGLINSYEYFQALKAGTAASYLRRQGMTIVFANPRLLALPPYHGQFAPYFERFGSFGGKDLLYLLEEPKY